ncbi:hypothetical protein AMTRI_Chr13g116420 [Amborella trichopoda]|uniref:Peptidase metallopeptidase domain-containing protein n=1 Tax=Amborella trichopoda TaxID=13333 RepID=W1P1E5_AMBTC|nr:metalloendoproteinase 4-MMP [Amborella trichopoda]ERN00765.1 hypothetical protein AMTR_s00106p00141160 [Amborella trichopoda]|eukprot:XP_020519663.1 metalloendoproteinase 4-MMP [Amborella trichopoda]
MNWWLQILATITISLLLSSPSSSHPLSQDFSSIPEPPFDPSNTWGGFSQFQDAPLGSNITGMVELKKYFQRFGYLLNPPNSSETLTDCFDEEFESAVRTYQARLSLSVTGRLDPDTLAQVMTPRCGMPDKGLGGPFHEVGHYAFFPGVPKWPRGKKALTYGISPTNMVNYLDMEDVRMALSRAFDRWSNVIPLNFTETQDYYGADIKIGFFSGDHGDGQPFDGVLGILAHAFSPSNGNFHLDASETWSTDFGVQKSRVAIDLESVATHEIGHLLGLGHSKEKEAIMYPSLSPRTKKMELRSDDIIGVQSLYGSNPNFDPNLLTQSDLLSNLGGEGIRGTWSVLLVLGLGFLICCL